MVIRDISPELKSAAREYPVTTIFGPRQSGKTTLAKMTFPGKPYYSMEDPDTRLAAGTDPRGFLSAIPNGAILDEIQRLPSLLSYLQGLVDQKNRRGLFVLTGSHQPEVHQAVSQTLAGRTALLTLLPFCVNELLAYKKKWAAFELIVRGAFPRLHQEKLTVGRFYNGYIQTYVERDVRSLVNIKDLGLFQKFLTLLAGRVGQVINYTSLGNDLGLTGTTIKNWVSVLNASFVIFELPPFFENIGKRVVKSPKIYFTDTGLACHLLGISTADQASRDPLRGGLYENLVILEILKSFYNRGQRPELFFYRDTHGNEVDLLIRRQRQITPIEIKSSATFTGEFLKGIKQFRKLTPKQSQPGYVLYNGASQHQVDGIVIQNMLVNGLPV
jgi:uncharacterized protein